MISIITPVYNGEDYIEECVSVVLKQTCNNIEHIFIDGDSTDNTVNILRELGKRYKHLRWISEKDKGQSDAMNKGVKMAHGKILGILNVDDYYEPDVLIRISALMKNSPEPSFIVGNCNVWNPDGKLKYVNKPKILKLEKLLLGFNCYPYPVNPSAYFYHSSLHLKAGYYDINDHYAMDLGFILRLVQHAHTSYIDEIWGNFRMLPGTKTVEDQTSGENVDRVGKLLKFYIDQLSPMKKKRMLLNGEICKLKNKLHKTRKKVIRKIKSAVKGIFCI